MSIADSPNVPDLPVDGDHVASRDATGESEVRLVASTSGSTLRLAVAGVIDFSTKAVFVDVVAMHLEEARDRSTDLTTDLRLDLDGVVLCDSSALSALIAIHRRVTAAGMRLHLDHQPPFLERMLTLTGLTDYFAASATSDIVVTEL